MKRKLSKREKSIENKIQYQKRKIKKIREELDKHRNEAWFNPDQEINVDGKLKKLKTVENELLNIATKANTQIHQLTVKRTKQFKKYKPKAKREIKPGEGDFLTGEFLAWERNDLIEEIANKKSLNGKDLAKDMDEVLFEVDALSIQMKSTDILQTYEDEDGNVKTVIVNAPDQVKRKRANYKYDKGTGKSTKKKKANIQRGSVPKITKGKKDSVHRARNGNDKNNRGSKRKK
jgi:hypothetical protein